VIGEEDVLALVPAVVVHVNPERIILGKELIDEPAMRIDHGVDASFGALEIRVEPDEPRGMPSHAQAVGQALTQLSQDGDHGHEATPGGGGGGGRGGKLVRLDVDTPDCRDQVHGRHVPMAVYRGLGVETAFSEPERALQANRILGREPGFPAARITRTSSGRSRRGGSTCLAR